jgi:hypothetical protein
LTDIKPGNDENLKNSLARLFLLSGGKVRKMDKIILNTRDAAKFLTVSPGTLQNWRSQKFNLPFHKLGGRVIYFRDELERFARGGEIKVVRGQKGKR